MNQEDIIRLAQEARVSLRGHYDETGSTPQELERFAALVAAAEREACARVCEAEFDKNGGVLETIEFIEAILARSSATAKNDLAVHCAPKNALS